MKCSEHSRASVRGEDGSLLKIRYRVVAEVCVGEGGGTRVHFGICVALRGGERRLLRRVTHDAEKIRDLADKLSRNLVTPRTLQSVVDDWLYT